MNILAREPEIPIKKMCVLSINYTVEIKMLGYVLGWVEQ